jgi:hypothetical protein
MSAGSEENAQNDDTSAVFKGHSKFIFHDGAPAGIFVPPPEISRSCKTSQTPRLRVSLRKFPLERGKPEINGDRYAHF